MEINLKVINHNDKQNYNKAHIEQDLIRDKNENMGNENLNSIVLKIKYVPIELKMKISQILNYINSAYYIQELIKMEFEHTMEQLIMANMQF